MGMFIALQIVFTRIIKPIDLPYLRVSFGFLASSFSSILMGPILGGINGAISDIAGFFLFPSPGAAFFPGFTISAFLTGLIYGIFLYKKPKTVLRIFFAVLTVSIFIDLFLNTLWLSILLDKAWMTFFIARLIKTTLFLPIQVFFIYIGWKYISPSLKYIFSNHSNSSDDDII